MPAAFKRGLCDGWCGRFVVEVPTLETPSKVVKFELLLGDYRASSQARASGNSRT